jgi:hypothetical protein
MKLKLKVAATKKVAYGEGEVVPPLVSDKLSSCAQGIISELLSTGAWSDDAVDILEESLDAALQSAAAEVFNSIKEAGFYPSFE